MVWHRKLLYDENKGEKEGCLWKILTIIRQILLKI